jgi:HPt (histidine-containing phosphotransfer) domain-containing protein
MIQLSNLALVEREFIDDLIREVGIANVRDLAATFFTEAEEHLVSLRDLTASHSGAIRFRLHTMYGSGGMFGLVRLSAFVRHLHGNAASIAPETYTHALDQLGELVAQSRDALHEVLSEVR